MCIYLVGSVFARLERKVLSLLRKDTDEKNVATAVILADL
jgi:hypothetical protein